MRTTGSRPKRLPEVLTEQELATLVRQTNPRAPTGARNRALLLTMGRCGLRVAEALALQVKDVEGDALHVWRGKGARDRTVPLDPQTAAAIEAWRSHRKKLGIRAHTLFCTITDRAEGEVVLKHAGSVSVATTPGQTISATYVHTLVKRLAKKAGIERNVHCHTLRHTAAVSFIRNGGDAFSLQRLLGHSTLAMTRHYCELADVDVKRVHITASPVDHLGLRGTDGRPIASAWHQLKHTSRKSSIGEITRFRR